MASGEFISCIINNKQLMNFNPSATVHSHQRRRDGT